MVPPARPAGTLPTTVPAPALIPDPLVVVEPEGADVIYVDPASPHAAVPDRPVSVLGSTLWEPGSLPAALPTEGPVDGTVQIASSITLAEDGSATWSAEATASGAAAEVIRQRLARLDEPARAAVAAALVGRGRPAVDPARVTLAVRGLDRTDRQLTLTVGGAEAVALERTPYGLRGEVPPLLAPGVAAWLPPRIRVTETLAVGVPSSVRLIGSSRPESASHPGAVIERSAVRHGQQLSLVTTVVRPERGVTAAQRTTAEEFLGDRAQTGVDVLLLGDGSGSIGARLDGLDDPDRVVLEALVRSGDPDVGDGRVRRLLARATGTARGLWAVLPGGPPEVGFAPLTTALQRYVEPADGRVWTILAGLAEAEADRAAVARGLAAVGRTDAALDTARALVGADDPAARLEALVLVDRLQGPHPDPQLEPERAELWVEPHLLAQRARDAATAAPHTGPPDPRPFVRSAELALEAGQPAQALQVMTGLDPATQPLVAVLTACAEAAGDLPAPLARQRVLAAVERAPADPHVLGAAADALAALGAAIPPGEALSYALGAARTAGDALRWERVVPVALAAGDLPTATDAARRASDLDPGSVVRARRWAVLATMMADREQTQLARARGKLPVPDGEEWPPSLDARLAMDESALLALLVYADREVRDTPPLLAIRGELRIAAGLLDDAAGDGLLLSSRHGLAEGAALTFAATAGREFSTPILAALDAAAATEPTAMLARMEYRLVAGTGDPLVDARRLGDEPRARALIQATTQPLLAVAAVEGWPDEVAVPTGRAPDGFHDNRALSSVRGVTGYSNPDAATAVVRVGAAFPKVPPPLAQLYTGRPRPVDAVRTGEVLRLDGGMMPLYAARAAEGGDQETWGLGFAPEGAKRARSAQGSAGRPPRPRPSGEPMRTVDQLMTPDPVEVVGSAPLATAAALMMRHHFRHLPVVDDADGRLLGLVDDAGVFARGEWTGGELRLHDARDRGIKVDDVRSPALSAHPTSSLSQALAAMVREGADALVVVDNHRRPVGILTAPYPGGSRCEPDPLPRQDELREQSRWGFPDSCSVHEVALP
ncbi:MAG: CBS domain-containing protein [Myxococcota bacterium]